MYCGFKKRKSSKEQRNSSITSYRYLFHLRLCFNPTDPAPANQLQTPPPKKKTPNMQSGGELTSSPLISRATRPVSRIWDFKHFFLRNDSGVALVCCRSPTTKRALAFGRQALLAVVVVVFFSPLQLPNSLAAGYNAEHRRLRPVSSPGRGSTPTIADVTLRSGRISGGERRRPRARARRGVASVRIKKKGRVGEEMAGNSV